MIINLISGPRNVSTAVMYSFAQRSDTTVIDEPLYAHYLYNTFVTHPGEEEVLATMNRNGQEVIDQLISEGKNHPILFIKNMAHHYVKLRFESLLEFKNIILTRDPRDMLPTLNRQLPKPILRDTAYKRQWELYNYLVNAGRDPLVIDAKIFLEKPGEILTQICEKLNMGFDTKMLSWKKGPKSYDGIWAKHWYHSIHKSEGFHAYNTRDHEFPVELEKLYLECKTYYERITINVLK